MRYDKLSKLFYKLEKQEYIDEIHRRKMSFSSYHTSLRIRGFRKGKRTADYFELFYVNIPHLMNTHTAVLQNSKKITELHSKLPSFIVKPYFQKLIINDAQSTNEVEGIRSTKRELREALEEIQKKEPRHKRFTSMIKTYLSIKHIKPFETIESFRKLYDALVADEIASGDEPDGKWFRRGYVEVSDGSQPTHIGIEKEENIINALQSLITFMQNNEHPLLYNYMIAHYYYEYIHPFYDGNGRTGRLIVGSYLARYLDEYSSLTFSYAVNKNKNKYYKAMEEIPSPLNQGEVTFYLIDMLEILADGQEKIIEDLELNLWKYEKVHSHLLKKNEHDYSEDEQKVLYFIVCTALFIDEGEVFSIQEIMERTNKTRYKVNQTMELLVQKQIVQQISQRPKAYKLHNESIENMLLL